MKSSRMFAAAAAALLLVSCGQNARIDGTLADAPQSDVIVRLLDVNKYQTLDTVKTDANGRYSYKVDVKKGQPEFVYLFHGDTRIASLLLQAGDKVKVSSDTLGKYSVEGSDETLKLMETERDQADFAAKLSASVAKLDDMDPASQEALQTRREISKEYIDYYRSRVKYVISNPFSLTVIPVLYENVTENMPLFGQVNDALHFRNASDSLMKVYPESKYVKALAEEAERREKQMELNARLSDAGSVSFPEITSSDINGKETKLSEVNAKVIMVYFWSSDASQKMFNNDVIKPIYEQFHDKGFEIYAVCLDTDKTEWATAVKNQNLPWINVCDGLGSASPSLTWYNVVSVPSSYYIVDGELVANTGVKDEASLRSYLASKLR